jgi:hypothetical protein
VARDDRGGEAAVVQLTPSGIAGLRAEVTNLMRAGAILLPVMDEDASTRFGRVCAAQLVDLALRRHLWFSYDGEHAGVPGLLAHRRPDPADAADADEQRLLDVVFGGEDVARIARPQPWARWRDMATLVRKGAKADGFGWLGRERYRVQRRMTDLRAAMSVHARRTQRKWSDAPALYRAGCSFAVLFDLDTAVPHWPMPPEEDLFVPSRLAAACHLAHVDAT